jgi:hypothetical protein
MQQQEKLPEAGSMSASATTQPAARPWLNCRLQAESLIERRSGGEYVGFMLGDLVPLRKKVCSSGFCEA